MTEFSQQKRNLEHSLSPPGYQRKLNFRLLKVLFHNSKKGALMFLHDFLPCLIVSLWKLEKFSASYPMQYQYCFSHVFIVLEELEIYMTFYSETYYNYCQLFDQKYLMKIQKGNEVKKYSPYPKRDRNINSIFVIFYQKQGQGWCKREGFKCCSKYGLGECQKLINVHETSLLQVSNSVFAKRA